MWDLKGRSARHPLRRIGGWIAPLLLAGSGVLLWMPLSHAQDRRRVKEPIVAATCKTLHARYLELHGVLEGNADTACATDCSACDTARIPVCGRNSAGRA